MYSHPGIQSKFPTAMELIHRWTSVMSEREETVGVLVRSFMRAVPLRLYSTSKPRMCGPFAVAELEEISRINPRKNSPLIFPFGTVYHPILFV